MAYIGVKPTIGNFQICDAISVVNGQAAYTMQVGSVNVIPQSANHMIVSLNGTIQKPNSSFTVSGSTITFSSNLATGDVIDFIQILGDVLDLGVPSDATVSNAKIVDDAVTSAKANFFNADTSAADLGSLHIKTGDSGASVAANYDEIVIENSSHAGMSILTGTSSVGAVRFGDSGDNDIGGVLYDHSNNDLTLKVNASDAAKIDSSANLKFNSGFGSVGTAYGVRVWVVFDGNNGSILDDGNVSSVTRFGTGNYRVNFSNNMPDINYSVTGSTIGNNYGTRQTFVTGDGGLKNVAYVNVQVVTTAPADHDNNRVNITVVR